MDEAMLLYLLMRERLMRKMREVIREARRKLEQGDFSLDELCIRVRLGKDPEEYKPPYPPHVKAAMILRSLGRDVRKGDEIAYVFVRHEPRVMPVELARPEDIDVERYMEMLFAVLSQVAEPFDIDVKALDERKKFEALL